METTRAPSSSRFRLRRLALPDGLDPRASHGEWRQEFRVTPARSVFPDPRRRDAEPARAVAALGPPPRRRVDGPSREETPASASRKVYTVLNSSILLNQTIGGASNVLSTRDLTNIKAAVSSLPATGARGAADRQKLNSSHRKDRNMTNVTVVIGAGSIGQAIARRVSALSLDGLHTRPFDCLVGVLHSRRNRLVDGSV